MTYTFSESVRVSGMFDKHTSTSDLPETMERLQTYLLNQNGKVIETGENYIEGRLGNTNFRATICPPDHLARRGEGRINLGFSTSDPRITKPIRRSFKSFKDPYAS